MKTDHKTHMILIKLEEALKGFGADSLTDHALFSAMNLYIIKRRARQEHLLRRGSNVFLMRRKIVPFKPRGRT